MPDETSSPPVALWPTLEWGEPTDYHVFTVTAVQRRSPRTDKVGTYQVLGAPDWVNVVARTPDGQIVLIEQYRHGIDGLTLEIPGGMVERGENAGAAGARELEEETGYVGDPPVLLGRVHPNPAIQVNTCYTYLIDNATPKGAMQWDDGEDIRVLTVPETEIHDLIRRGAITHSLVVAALFWLDLQRDP